MDVKSEGSTPYRDASLCPFSDASFSMFFFPWRTRQKNFDNGTSEKFMQRKETIMLSYTVSWILNAVFYIICVFVIYRKYVKTGICKKI